MKIYTDGSIRRDKIGWGFVSVLNDTEIHASYGQLDGPSTLRNQRNIAGEMKAVIEAINWAKKEGYKSITIYHDYTGCSKWPDREWQSRNEFTQKYAQYVNKIRNKMDIKFVWVKGHSGDKWNDRADELAGLGAEKAN